MLCGVEVLVTSDSIHGASRRPVEAVRSVFLRRSVPPVFVRQYTAMEAGCLLCPAGTAIIDLRATLNGARHAGLGEDTLMEEPCPNVARERVKDGHNTSRTTTFRTQSRRSLRSIHVTSLSLSSRKQNKNAQRKHEASARITTVIHFRMDARFNIYENSNSLNARLIDTVRNTRLIERETY